MPLKLHSFHQKLKKKFSPYFKSWFEFNFPNQFLAYVDDREREREKDILLIIDFFPFQLDIPLRCFLSLSPSSYKIARILKHQFFNSKQIDLKISRKQFVYPNRILHRNAVNHKSTYAVLKYFPPIFGRFLNTKSGNKYLDYVKR